MVDSHLIYLSHFGPKKAENAWRLHRSHTGLRITAAEGRKITGRRGGQGWPAQITTPIERTLKCRSQAARSPRSYTHSPIDQAVPTAFVHTHMQRFSDASFFFPKKFSYRIVYS